MPFIENMGQVKNKDVSFYAKIFGGTVFVEKNGVLTYKLPAKDKKVVVIKEIFTEKRIKIAGSKPSPTRVNCFIGKDKKNWRTNIPSYDTLSLGKVYRGIDLSLRAYGNNVEKLFTVLPEEDPKIIKIKVTGCKELKVNEKGELELMTEPGSVKFTKPFAYQNIGGKQKPVEAAYIIYKGNTYGFKVGSYDKKRPLIIDPLLASTFIGGDSAGAGHSIAIDGTGDVYVTGYTYSSDFPTTSGVYDESQNGICDVFVSRLDSSLSTLRASTFIGGGYNDYGLSIAIDGTGDVYVTGYTWSYNFPTTPGAYDASYDGSFDVFVSRLDSGLGTLLASTLIGGGSEDSGRSIAIDETGDVYVAGYTWSSDFPATPGAYDESFNGICDVFVSRLDSNLSTLRASTFIGGDSDDSGSSIAIDGTGDVYITGRTYSSDFPTTPGAYDESQNGICDVFVSRLDSSLSTLGASTFIGGDSNDYGLSIAIAGDVYVTGHTWSSDFPTTPGAYDASLDRYYDAFVSRLDSSLSTLGASTFIGGDSDDSGRSIAIDGTGDVYITGKTDSSDFPTTPGVYDASHDGCYDVFISKLDSSLSTLPASTFIGGGTSDCGNSIAIDETGDVYVTGDTKSSDFPTTPGAYDASLDGNYDAFVSKLEGDLSAANPCEGDFDGDGDVDGSDLAVFSADFGRTDCSPDNPCKGNFDHDGDVDDSDLVVFAEDFGKTG